MASQAQQAFAAYAERLRAHAGRRLQLGYLGSEAAPGRPASLMVTIVLAHELGLGVPERPFLRHTLDSRRLELSEGLTRAARAEAQQGRGLDGLRIVAGQGVGYVQESIRSGPWTPNAPATIREKGSSKPLIDTGQMRQSARAVLIDGQREEVVG